MLSSAVGLCCASARATLPNVSSAIEVTNTNHKVGTGTDNNEDSIMVRVGSDLYFIYRRAVDGDSDTIWVRPYHLNSSNNGTPVEVDDTTDDASGGDSYHSEPSLLRDAMGALHPFVWYQPLVADTFETYSMAPRHRMIPNLGESEYWSSPDAINSWYYNDGGGVSVNFTANLSDLSGVYDSLTGTTHLVGAGANLNVMFGETAGGCNNGLSRGYYRILPDEYSTLDGPYLLVKTPSCEPAYFDGTPVEWPYIVDNEHPDTHDVCLGNTFAKGDIVLGKESEGPRSLHVMWNTRNTYYAYPEATTRPCDPADTDNAPVEWNYDLYYAKSVDGGNTWTSAGDLHPKYVVDYGESIDWNDSNFVAYTGDVDQNSERAFDVLPNGRPIVVFCKYHAGTGFMVGDSSLHHVNRADGETPPQYDLAYREWNGSSWTGSDIDTTRNYLDARPKVRVDMDGGVWVFAASPFTNQVPSYWYRTPGGSWSEWATPFGDSTDHPGHLYSYADPLDPNFHYIAWVAATGEYNDHKLFFRKLQLTQNLLEPDTDVPSGTYDNPQTVHVTPCGAQFGIGGAVVHYTTDGTNPSSGSPSYPGGGLFVNWNQTKVIKVRTYASGWTAGPIRTITVHVNAS